jgi:MarR family transcriptional regulator, organic hydroperoxide resistance regulator
MYKLTGSVPYLLNRVGVRMGELFSRHIAAYGVTLPMYRVMAALWEVPNQRLNDLSVMTTVEISTLSRLIGTMEKMKLVSRSRLENNARTVAINLTKGGNKLVTELMPIAQHFEEVAVSNLSPTTLKVLKKTLGDIYERLDAIEDELTVSEDAPLNRVSSA